ncbi:MAG: DUF2520 domain-containing protein [Pseudomonadota bacterium]
MRYAIFGTGRVGGSMATYLRSLGHEVAAIRRTTDADTARRAVDDADVVAAATPDDVLPSWAAQWVPVAPGKVFVHFAGAVALAGVRRFHPLYSFGPQPLAPAEVARVAFACEPDGPSFADVFPGATNPTFVVGSEDAAYYHALAVVSGNLAAFVWNETARRFRARLDAPAAALAPYFRSLVDRFEEAPEHSLTGPVARQDRRTVARNLAALADDPELGGLYRAFLAAAWPEFDGDPGAGAATAADEP